MSCHDEHAGGCLDLMTERIRYFTGRHMSAQDFEDADAHHRSFRHLHNRILHGWGVACGLDVRLHPREECRRDRVVVRCGLAIDCCGREIVVPRDVVSAPIRWDEKPKEDGTPEGRLVLALCLTYCERRTHKVPVLYSSSACAGPDLEYGRVKEEYCLCWKWVKRSELGTYGWRTAQRCPPPKVDEAQRVAPKDQAQESAPDPCDDDGDDRCCLKPDCPPDHCVILALIRPKDDGIDSRDDIDTSGRRTVVQAREHLTHICWTNWPHGGVVKLSDLDALRVRFDRPLRIVPQPKRHNGPRGINGATFYVEYGGDREDDLDFVRPTRRPYLTPDGRTAVFEISDHAREVLANHAVHVTLLCDFLEDCHGNPVDGDHLGGRLPTGNGVAGGVFRSWFKVVEDHDYERAVQESAGTYDETEKESAS